MSKKKSVFLPLVPTGSPALRGNAGISWPTEDPYDRAQSLVDMGAVATFDWGCWNESKWQRAEAAGLVFLPALYEWDNIDTKQLREAARRHRGSHWLLFNEPDISDCSPLQAAHAFHIAHQVIRRGDPAAVLYGCGTAFSPAHIEWHAQWGEEYRRIFGSYPDVRPHIHSYAADWEDRFNWPARKGELIAFRRWQRTLDWFQGSVIISEWGVLTGYWHNERQRIAEYVAEALPWLNSQPWIKWHLYFTSYVPDVYRHSSTHLRDSNNETVVGGAWRDAQG